MRNGCGLKAGGIILAGGRGTRLGREKAWVELAGTTLLQRAVLNLEGLCGGITIVKSPGAMLPPIKSDLEIKIAQDVVGGMGPIAGIAAGLAASDFEYNVVLACDMPLANPLLLQYMTMKAGGWDVVVPRENWKLEPLQAVYSKGCLDEAERLLAQNLLKVDCLFNSVRTLFIEADVIKRFDPECLSFFNINTADDLARAATLLDTMG